MSQPEATIPKQAKHKGLGCIRFVRRLCIRQLRIDFDHEYGISQRTGWSIVVDGSYCVQFESSLIAAIWKAFRYTLRRNKEMGYLPDDEPNAADETRRP
jgi:hypothetical protein